MGEGSTITTAIKRARKHAVEGGEVLISGQVDVYRLCDDYDRDYYGELVQMFSSYVGSFCV